MQLWIASMVLWHRRRRMFRFRDRKYLDYQVEVMSRQVEEVNEIYMKMRGWRHDYHNHLQKLKAHLAMGQFAEAEKYLNELEGDLDGIKVKYATGNVSLDAILNSKLSIAEKEDIRIFKMYDVIRKKGMEARGDIENAQKQAIRETQKIGALAQLAQNFFIVAVYAYVGIKAIYGMITIGDVTKYISAITLLQTQIGSLFALLISINTQNSYLDSYNELMDVKNVKYEGTLPVEKRYDNEYELEFRGVSFHYPNNDRMVLKNVSFRLKQGWKLAIVGANGAGKTTFIKLLCRLYDPTEGEIVLNGIDIRKYDYDEYIRLFSIVFQDYKIFSFSVAAGPVFDKDRVIKSLQDAGIYERVLTMKSGIDSRLLKDQQDGDEEGIEISGGEKQKIALARALYRDAPLVILDEPTSALDPIAEQDIYMRFNDMVKEKTAVFISHRMSSCRFCDEIVVFDEGRIVQNGTHDVLVTDAGGIYHKMWEAQAQYYI